MGSRTDPKLYDTPPWCVTALLAHEHFSGDVFDPACGTGSIVKTIKAAGYADYAVEGSDLHDHGFGETGIDFFKITEGQDNIITNPPYGGGLDTEFAIHAAKLCRGKVAILLPLRFLAGGKRIETLHMTYPFARVWILSERPTMYRPGAQVAGGGMIDYAWFVWPALPMRGPSQVRFIEKGFRPGPSYAEQMDMDKAIEIFKSKGGFK